MRTNVWIYQALVCVMVTTIDSGKMNYTFGLSSVHNWWWWGG